jgi:uroporphyrinogen decarboxylase
MERVKAAFKRTFADMVPAYPILGAFSAQLIGKSTREYLLDPEAMADAQLAANERYQPDIVVVMADLLLEVEAMGATLIFPEDAMCQLKEYPLKEKGQLASLRVPVPERDGRLPLYLEACGRVRREVKDAAVGGTLLGPWAMAASLRGIENLIYDTYEDPAFVHELVKFCVEVAKVTGDSLLDTGTGLSYSEATVSCSVISPKIYQAFIKPYHEELMKYYRDKRATLTLHVCGYIDPIMQDLVDVGAGALSIDAVSSLRKMVETSGKKVVVIGNVATTTFQRGVKEQIERETRECIDTARAQSAFILSSGCEVPPTTAPETVDHFMRVAREYGRYQAETSHH